MADLTTVKAENFYSLFRSGNSAEMRQAVQKLAQTSGFDTKDMAFFVIILQSTTSRLRHHVLASREAKKAVLEILDKATDPCVKDVEYIKDVLKLHDAA